MRSISGARFSTFITALTQDWSSLQVPWRPDEIELLIMHIGTNNIWEDHSRMQQQCTDLLDAVSTHLPRAVLGLTAILPRPRDAWVLLPKIMDYNTWLASISQDKGFIFVDTFRTFTGLHQTAKSGLFKDGLHLNEKGLRSLRDRLVAALAQMRKTKIWD